MEGQEKPADALLTLADLAKHLQVSKRTVQQMVSDGECPAPTKIGKAVRWRWGRVRKWVEAVELLQEIQRQAECEKTQEDAKERRSTQKSTRGHSAPSDKPKDG